MALPGRPNAGLSYSRFAAIDTDSDEEEGGVKGRGGGEASTSAGGRGGGPSSSVPPRAGGPSGARAGSEAGAAHLNMLPDMGSMFDRLPHFDPTAKEWRDGAGNLVSVDGEEDEEGDGGGQGGKGRSPFGSAGGANGATGGRKGGGPRAPGTVPAAVLEALGAEANLQQFANIAMRGGLGGAMPPPPPAASPKNPTKKGAVPGRGP